MCEGGCDLTPEQYEWFLKTYGDEEE